jgi:hypothetical protein
MAVVLRRCRELYNAALTERREAWRRRRVSSTVAGQSAQLPDIKQERPEYQAIHSPVWQDVLTRLDRACQAFFRRVQHGEQPGLSPRPAGRPLRQLHRPAIRQWGPAGHWLSGAQQDRAPRAALEPAAARHTQNGHHPASSGRLVRLLLL